MDTNEQLLKRALDLWGSPTQIDILIEEMSELTHALLKARRSESVNGLSWDVLEELVDVEICLAQLHLMFKQNMSSEIQDLYNREYSRKMTRLESRIKQYEGVTDGKNEEECGSCGC